MPAATDSALARYGAGTALLATLAALLGALVGVVNPAGGADPRPVVAALVCAVVAMLVPPLVALIWAPRRAAAAGGALAGFGAVSAVLLVSDVELLRRPIDANRFEVLRPVSAAELAVAPGAYLVLFGHVLGVLAGVLGALALQRASIRDGYGGSVEPELSGRSVALRAGPWWAVPTAATALVLVAASIAAPWRVHDAVLLVRPLVESGGLAIAAAAVLGVVLLAGVAVALATPEAWTSAGLLIGLGATGFAVIGTRVAAGVDEGLTPTVTAWLAALSCVALIAAGAVV
ncbi:MAG: hypothetical protein ICV72_06850, partial [Aldersonia sp.]|nr:hypothetical protein [Aldersonia sp.]